MNFEIIRELEKEQLKKEVPQFATGDTVRVHNRIKEGTRERVQIFEGTVIKIQGGGARTTFTVRKISNGIGVEKTFPFSSPFVDKVEVIRKVRSEEQSSTTSESFPARLRRSRKLSNNPNRMEHAGDNRKIVPRFFYQILLHHGQWFMARGMVISGKGGMPVWITSLKDRCSGTECVSLCR